MNSTFLSEEAEVVGAGVAEVLVGEGGYLAAAGSALDEAFLYEVWLIDLLDGAGVFAERRGDCCEADGAAAELVDDGAQYLVVDFVEAVAVDIKGLEGIAGNFEVDTA